MFTGQKEGECPHSESQPQAGLQVSAWVLCLYHCPEKNTPRLARWPRRMKHMWSRASQAQPRGANSPLICTSQRRNSFHFKPGPGTSLLAQWLTLRLPTQGTGFNPWSRRSHMPGGIKDHVSQPLEPAGPRACAPERSRHSEEPVHPKDPVRPKISDFKSQHAKPTDSAHHTQCGRLSRIPITPPRFQLPALGPPAIHHPCYLRTTILNTDLTHGSLA